MPGKRASKEADAGGRGYWPVFLVLLAGVIASAVAVVYASHKSRHLINELQVLEEGRNALQQEWGQLLLEQSSMASQGRIEEIAISELGMEFPTMQDIVVVRNNWKQEQQQQADGSRVNIE